MLRERGEEIRYCMGEGYVWKEVSGGRGEEALCVRKKVLCGRWKVLCRIGKEGELWERGGGQE